MKFKFYASVVGLLLVGLNRSYCEEKPVWSWECMKGFCQKVRVTPQTENSAVSLPVCRLFCHNHAGLWPMPTGEVSVGNTLLHIDVNNIKISSGKSDTSLSKLLNSATKRFKENLHSLAPGNVRLTGGRTMTINIDIADPLATQLTLATDESYILTITKENDDSVNVTIKAPTYFGSRHALETLGQLMIYDDIRNEMQVPTNVHITDKPSYPYRGILLDTSRNYVSVEGIKRTIRGIAASKLNTFHWHITDSQSFPYVSKSQPKLSQLGAYSPKQIYTPEDVEEIVQYGKELGVRVMPEFDAPAHVGEGWQDTDFVACFNKKPWQVYCVEPPCGQFDPTKEGLYDALEGIYKDMMEQFNPDIFHMGGDEVALACWNTTDSITKWMEENGWGRKEEDFMKLWNLFQSQALERVYKQAGRQIPVIMWTSTLTKKEYVETYLPKDKYIIQIWTTGTDAQIQELLDRGYRLILSNYDALYLDCGFGGWVQDGNNWCSPYIGWQKVYSNSPAKIGGSKVNQILGGEAALWTEQADESSIDAKLWPRAAALAERLWAEPSSSWRDAEQRMLVHRERLVTKGIAAESLEPQWCMQNEENCPIGGVFNTPNS